MSWVFFLKQKSDVFVAFQKFKILVENEAGCQIKKLRSNNGTEYTAGEFKKFCDQAGIQHQFIVPYTPQQSRVSERKNRTMMEMAQCLLFEKGLPKTFWAEAVNTSVYLLNLLPTKALKGKTPYEAWCGRKPSVEHLKIFGCVCYTHVPNVKRDKIDHKCEVGIFLGYSINSKGYRVYNLETKKIIVSRDIKFDEFSKWNWKKHQAEGSSKRLFDEDTLQEQNSKDDEENYDSDTEFPVRGTRTLEDIYARCNFAALEPTRYEEVAEFENWRATMKEEIKMIEKNKTWQLVDRPSNKKVIGVKWVYRTKLNPDGSVNKLKARLVVKGYFQQYGVDFSDTFAPVARHDTIRLLISLATKLGWKIYHFDVKSAFLNGLLDEDIYVDQLEGFQVQEVKIKFISFIKLFMA
uniref:Retrovirus-related Pol polyprotein from transposon TNT 1-94 n=1 Tax=Cajanus cajan TaxID=3821 RepID=A0A151R1S6_CAJCA|nr:Retrovirus-related Pol polyprotein from transposon TNT 1-94 [Cajanus cajan]